MAKRVLLPTNLIAFNPGPATAGTIDFTLVPNFDARKVLAVLNITVGQTIIYAVSSSAQNLGGSWSGSVVTLQTDTSSMNSGDLLQVIYDDGEVGIYDAANQPIYSSVDLIGMDRNGLDINLLNGSVIGQVNSPLPDPYGDAALSVAFNQGGNLKSPRMDPVTNELMTKVVSTSGDPVYVEVTNPGSSVNQGSSPWLSQLVDGSNNALQTNLGVYDAQTLRVVLATGQTYPVNGTVNLATNNTQDFAVTYTTSGQTGQITTGTYSSMTFQIQSQTVTGTNPTLDIKIQESVDGNIWFDTYHFPRFTGSNQSFVSPPIRLFGTWIRYVRTIGGTSPSFNMVATRINRSGPDASLNKMFFDRTINLNTLNSTSGSYYVGGCDTIEMTVCNGAGGTGTNPHISIQLSDDNINWTTLTGSGVVANLAPSTCGLASVSGYQPKFARGIVTTAGTSGHTLNYVCIKGYGA